MANRQTLNPLPVDHWDSSLQPIIDDMKGSPINVHKLMAHNPALLNAWWSYRNHSVTGGSLGKRLGELVILRVAVHMRAWYEWGAHVERGMACGLSLQEIERVKGKPVPTDWEEGEYLLLVAVDELVTRHALPPALLEKLKARYSDAQILDLMAIQGMYVTLGCMINTWGLKLDQHVQDKLPETITQADFEAEFPG